MDSSNIALPRSWVSLLRKLAYEKNKDLSNQLDVMVSQCQRMNAGKIRMSFKKKE